MTMYSWSYQLWKVSVNPQEMPETFNGLLAEHYIRVLGVLYLFGNCEPFFLYVPIIPSINLQRNEETKNAQLYKRQLWLEAKHNT